MDRAHVPTYITDSYQSHLIQVCCSPNHPLWHPIEFCLLVG